MMDGMRFAVAMTVAGLLALPTMPAWAGGAAGTRTAAKTGPLKPGQSAGVHGAQQVRTGFALVSAGAILAVVLVAATAGGSGNSGQPNSQSVPATAP